MIAYLPIKILQHNNTTQNLKTNQNLKTMKTLISNSEKLSFNSELKKEVKTLGHCLTVLEKCNVQSETADKIRTAAKLARESSQYELLKANVKPTKNGNYSVWAVLSYLNKAYKA